MLHKLGFFPFLWRYIMLYLPHQLIALYLPRHQEMKKHQPEHFNSCINSLIKIWKISFISRLAPILCNIFTAKNLPGKPSAESS